MEELWRFDLTMRKILDCFVVKCFREEEVLENPRDAFSYQYPAYESDV